MLAAMCSCAPNSYAQTPAPAPAKVAVDASLQQKLASVYNTWRESMLRGNMTLWQSTTARSRQLKVRNLAVSEKKAWPKCLFVRPVVPPALGGLKCIVAASKNDTATLAYFGKIDFGIGGEPQDNILVLCFLREAGAWKYDSARFFALDGLKDFRQQLASGNYSELEKHDGLWPNGQQEALPALCQPPKYIAKIFVDAPGRKVTANIGNASLHQLQDIRKAEIITGGLQDGKASLQLKIENLEQQPQGHLTVGIFIMPEIVGQLPAKVYEQYWPKGQTPPAELQVELNVTPEIIASMNRKPKQPNKSEQPKP